MRLEETKTGGRTVPVPNHHEIAIGTLKSIITQSGLPADLFRK
jgi:predicted RNA binding protein YcfA (HicA-like mRNA interferase family)